MAPDAWIICAHFRVRIWGGREKGIIRANRSLLCLGLKTESLPHDHFRQMPLANVSRQPSSSLPPRAFSPAQFLIILAWASSAMWKREASKQSFLFFSLICCFLHICPSSLPHEPKMQLPTFEAQTHISHNLNDKDSFIFIEFYASFNRNWSAFMHFISQLVWIYIGICFLIKFFFFFD